MIEEKTYNYDNFSYSKTFEYKYNYLDQKVSEKSYDADGNFLYEYIYTYDLKGNLIEIKFYNEFGILSYTNSFKYDYDKYGNWIKKIKYKNTIPIDLIKRKIQYYN